MKIEKNDMVMVYDGGGTVPHCKYTGWFSSASLGHRIHRTAFAKELKGHRERDVPLFRCNVSRERVNG